MHRFDTNEFSFSHVMKASLFTSSARIPREEETIGSNFGYRRSIAGLAGRAARIIPITARARRKQAGKRCEKTPSLGKAFLP